MCGLIGGMNLGAGPYAIRKAIPWIKRRGPDSQGVWVSDDGRVELLQARLSIVDRDPRANQPFLCPDQSVAVGFVGEIYNYGELKTRFGDYSFSTESDTEVISAVYSRLGESGFRLLKGMFTIALVDQKRKRVFLARDPVGKKPLYLAKWNRQVLFGSSLLPMLAVSEVKASVNGSVLNSFWKDGYVPANLSALVGAMPVMPGEVLELDWHGEIVGRHSCSPPAGLLYRGESLTEIRRNVSGLLREAVKRRLTNNPRPVALLSGGVDSTIVTMETKRVLDELDTDRELATLTLGSVVPFTNDERYAIYAAKNLGLGNQILRLSYRSLGDSVLNALDIQDEPLAMPSYFVLERLVNLASDHGSILITGDGGDEVFLGYESPACWRSEVGKTNYGKHDYPYKLSSPVWLSPWGREVTGLGFVGHMLAKADRASAEQGVEIRCPLLDWDLICYTRSLPFDILTNGNRSKALLKDLLADWPIWFTERTKRGFTYNLRWIWGLAQYAGMRESVQKSTVDTFGELLPPVLRKPPIDWSTRDIFSNFIDAWRLLVWSRFEARIKMAEATAGN